MFGHRFYGGRYYGPRYFGDGGDAAPVVIAETYSGGWGRKGRASPFETETETERKVRIHAERVRLGILAPDPEPPAALEAAGAAIAGGAATRVSPHPSVFDGSAQDSGLAEELARLHTSAWLDAEIRRHFALQDRDDEEAMFVILAVAETLH